MADKRLVDAVAVRDALYDADAITMKGVAIINRFPTVDAVEVVRSRWKYYKKQGIAVCINCSFERKLDDDFGKAVACPNCGAMMDGGSNHE